MKGCQIHTMQSYADRKENLSCPTLVKSLHAI